jgi:hypothetical protein
MLHELAVPPANAHDRSARWDIAGAAHAGLATGFITREGQASILCPLHLIL